MKIAIIAAFTDNLDAATRTKLINRFVAAYQLEWNASIAAGTIVDNPTNRGIFTVNKVFDYIQDIFESESHKENIAAVPEPEKIT